MQAPPVPTVATGMDPNCFTQVFPGASPSATGSVISELSMSVGAPRSGDRVSNTPATTARKPPKGRAPGVSGPKPQAQPHCKVGVRVVVETKHLHHRVRAEEPARHVLDAHNEQNYNFYGHVLSKAKRNVWRIKFDLFPNDQCPVPVAREHIKKILRAGEEEPAYDREQDSEPEDLPPAQAQKKAAKKKGTKDYVKESTSSFLALGRQAMLDARSMDYRYGAKENEVIKWQILSEMEEIVQCPMEQELAAKQAIVEGRSSRKPAGMTCASAGARVEELTNTLASLSPLKKDIPWNRDPHKVDYSSVFFDHFFASLEGTAKVADEILGNPRCGYHVSAMSQGIRFYRPEHDDPDHLVRCAFFSKLSPVQCSPFGRVLD